MANKPPKKADTRSRVPLRRDELKTSRANWVYDRLRMAIHAGEFVRGERIREEHVAQWLEVSRTPVREALGRLESAGLLESVASGLVIAELTRTQVHELYAIREVLEGSAARFAAQRAAPSEIATLRQIADVFSQHLDDPVKLTELNRDIHSAIYEAAHNRYLLKTLNELQDTLALLQRTTFEVEGRGALAVKEHADIINAIENRDADQAERLARHHIRSAQLARMSLMFSSNR